MVLGQAVRVAVVAVTALAVDAQQTYLLSTSEALRLVGLLHGGGGWEFGRLRVPAKSTTGKCSCGLLRLEPVEPKKRLPVLLRFGLYAKGDGALLCAHRTVRLDSASGEAREREQQISLELSNTASAYDNQLLELRLEQLLEGVNTPVLYKTKDVKLLRPFGSDFDDF